MSEIEVSNLLARVLSQVPLPAEGRKSQSLPEKKVETAVLASDAGLQWRQPGIYSQTHVTTNFGKVPAHLIRVGDRVRTRSGFFRPVKAVREFKTDLDFIDRHPDAMPVLIAKGSINGKVPTQDVLLSGAQSLTLEARGTNPEMLRAADLRGGRRVFDRSLRIASYYEFQFDELEEIDCDGIWVRCEPKRSRSQGYSSNPVLQRRNEIRNRFARNRDFSGEKTFVTHL